MNTGKNNRNKGDFSFQKRRKKENLTVQTYVIYMISAIYVMKCSSHQASFYFICYNKSLMMMMMTAYFVLMTDRTLPHLLHRYLPKS